LFLFKKNLEIDTGNLREIEEISDVPRLFIVHELVNKPYLGQIFTGNPSAFLVLVKMIFDIKASLPTPSSFLGNNCSYILGR
jgi:hypothetical protein